MGGVFGLFGAWLPTGAWAKIVERTPGVFQVSNSAESAGPITVSGIEIPPGGGETDDDGDAFFTSVEAYIGTDPLDACPDVVASPGLCPGPSCNGDDCWPPDLDVDRQADIADVLKFKPIFATFGFPCQGQPGYDNRFDLNMNGCIAISDVLQYKPVIPSQCTNP